MATGSAVSRLAALGIVLPVPACKLVAAIRCCTPVSSPCQPPLLITCHTSSQVLLCNMIIPPVVFTVVLCSPLLTTVSRNT
jgi:hypothetical protein